MLKKLVIGTSIYVGSLRLGMVIGGESFQIIYKIILDIGLFSIIFYVVCMFLKSLNFFERTNN